MHKHPIGLLGVSFDNVTLEEAAQKILSLVNLHAHDGINRYVCTVNVDFIAKAHSVFWNVVDDPELLHIYRSSHLVTCDGVPLIWLSWLLGSPLQSRVTGADLAPKVAAALVSSNKGLYLLGGGGNINKATALILESMCPGLRVVGGASPRVYIEGEELLNIDDQDPLLVEEINRTAPDVLMIAFGNPKQEKWFNRVKTLLNVPVSIGVGGTFDMISGALSRAPSYVQKIGMEWLYRLGQEPKRLWKRYFVDIWKFACLAIPLVGYHTTSRILYRCFSKKTEKAVAPLLFISTTQTIAIVPLPSLICEEYCHLVHTQLEETFNQDTVILDFDNVRHITLEGFSLLIKMWLKAEQSGKELYAMNVSGDLKLLMKVHRIWDLVEHSVMNNPEQVLKALIQGNNHPNYFDSVQDHGNDVILYFFGQIDGDQNRLSYIEKLSPLLRDRDCILDFRYCTFIDNEGFSFLLKLREMSLSHAHNLYVRKRTRAVKRMFKINGLEQVFIEHHGRNNY